MIKRSQQILIGHLDGRGDEGKGIGNGKLGLMLSDSRGKEEMGLEVGEKVVRIAPMAEQEGLEDGGESQSWWRWLSSST